MAILYRHNLQNVMDNKPFYTIKFGSIDAGLEVLPKFSKALFTPEKLNEYATELLYTAKIADFLRSEIDLRDQMPSEYMIRWILKSPDMFDGIVNANTIERFKSITKSAFTRVIRGIVRRSISAMDDEVEKAENNSSDNDNNDCKNQTNQEDDKDTKEVKETNPNIVTTENELRFFDLVKTIYQEAGLEEREIFDASKKQNVPNEINYKDTTGYFGIYLNKPSWWAMRLHIETRRPWLGFNLSPEVGSSLVQDESIIIPGNAYADFRISIESVEDINDLKDLVIASLEKIFQDRTPTS